MFIHHKSIFYDILSNFKEKYFNNYYFSIKLTFFKSKASRKSTVKNRNSFLRGRNNFRDVYI